MWLCLCAVLVCHTVCTARVLLLLLLLQHVHYTHTHADTLHTQLFGQQKVVLLLRKSNQSHFAEERKTEPQLVDRPIQKHRCGAHFHYTMSSSAAAGADDDKSHLQGIRITSKDYVIEDLPFEMPPTPKAGEDASNGAGAGAGAGAVAGAGRTSPSSSRRRSRASKRKSRGSRASRGSRGSRSSRDGNTMLTRLKLARPPIDQEFYDVFTAARAYSESQHSGFEGILRVLCEVSHHPSAWFHAPTCTQTR